MSTTASTMMAVSKFNKAKFAKRMKPTMPEDKYQCVRDRVFKFLAVAG